MGRVDNGDVGRQAIIRGISLEGKRFDGAEEIQGVKTDVFGDAVAVQVGGETLHFRQNDIADVTLGKKPESVTGGQPGGCAVIPMLMAAGGALAALAGAKYGIL